MQCQNPPSFFVRISHHGRNGVREVRRSIGFHRLGITQKFVFKGIGRFHGSATADWIPPFGGNAKVDSKKKYLIILVRFAERD